MTLEIYATQLSSWKPATRRLEPTEANRFKKALLDPIAREVKINQGDSKVKNLNKLF